MSTQKQTKDRPDENDSQDTDQANNRLVEMDSHLQGGKIETYELGQREGH